MAIPSSGCFDYSVVVGRDGPTWRGSGETLSKPSLHPGLAGGRPSIEVAKGLITLRSTESWLGAKINSHFRLWGPPASLVRFAIGPAPETVLEAGDVLKLSRHATGDLAVSVHSGESLKISLGAVGPYHLSPEISVEEDPRAHETSLFDVVRSLDEPDTTLIWLNVSDVDHEASVRAIEQAPPGRLVIAIAGPDPDERRRMNRRVSESDRPLPPGRSSCRYVDVDARFRTREEWLEYLRILPKTRPDDLWLRINIGETATTVCEGAYSFVAPWHLFVRKVYKPGVPGECSQLGIARTSPAITQTALIESTNAVASRGIEIRD